MQIDVLGERYQIQDPIGRGGMATIYRGRDLRTDHIVAIKLLREVYSTDPKFVTRFQREAKAASSLHHPNIVQVYDYGQSEGNYFIVMEYIEGTDLRRYLRSRGVLAVDRVIRVARDVALGLGAAHRRQIVHRDVKPQNILVGRDGSIKLTDFGIASVYKDINDERLTTTGMTLGTVQYYAPEQAQGEIVNPAADVYALGIVMYEMLTGRTPFDGDTPVAVAMQHIQDIPTPPTQFNPNIPPPLENIIMRCLEKTPEMRYRDGNALARAIELLGEKDGGVAKTTSTSSSNPGIAETSSSNNKRDSLAGIANNYSAAPSNSSPNQQMTMPPNSDRPDRQYAPANENVSPVQDIRPVLENSDANSLRAGIYPQPSSDAPIETSDQVVSYDVPAHVDLEATRPLRKGDSGQQQESQDSRVVTVVTVLILLFTLLLLGFSIYLASQLGFISLPGTQSPSATPTSENIQSGVKMPNLIGKSVTQAQEFLKKVGIQPDQIRLEPNDPTATLVIGTNPTAGNTVRAGQTVILYVASSTPGSVTPIPTSQNTLPGQPIQNTPPVSTPLPSTPVPTSTSPSTPISSPAPTPTVAPTSSPVPTVTPTSPSTPATSSTSG